MKVLSQVLLLFLFAASVLSQTVADSVVTPNVEVIQKQWRVERHNPLLDEKPLRLVDEINQQEINRRNQRQNSIRARQMMPLEPPPEPMAETEPEQPGEITTRYIYEVKFRNNGEKVIQALIWDYVFSEPGTDKEVGRRRFVSKANISPGKTKNLVLRTAAPPTGAINAKNAGKKLREQYSEQVVIQGIHYADGSVWQAATAAGNRAVKPTKPLR